MQALFDSKLRGLRRDRAARLGPELFLHQRAFDDCLERLDLLERSFDRAILIGCPDASWGDRFGAYAHQVDTCDPSPLFASRAGGTLLIEDGWEPRAETYDLVLAVGTLDTVNDLALALRLIRHAMRPDGLFLGAMSGGDTLPRLRAAMRAADAVSGVASPHIHPRIEAAALAPLLASAGFARPVVDVDRVNVSYPNFGKLVADLRQMGATNILTSRSQFVSRAARAKAVASFESEARGERTIETFEILHFAAWTPPNG